MGQRKWHGIFGASFSLDNFSAETPITNPVGNQSGVVFEDIPDDHPKDPFNNNYAAPEFRVYTYTFLDKTQYDAMKANHDADTEQYFKFTLDNGETHQTKIPILPQQLKPTDIEGTVQGRSNQYQLVVRIHKDQILEVTA